MLSSSARIACLGAVGRGKLPILQYPHPTLAAKAEVVTVFDDELRKLAEDMAETMYAAPGVGLAANQVGVLKRIVVIDVSEDKSDLIDSRQPAYSFNRRRTCRP